MSDKNKLLQYLRRTIIILIAGFIMYFMYNIATMPSKENTISILENKNMNEIIEFIDILKEESQKERDIDELDIAEDALEYIDESSIELESIHVNLFGEIEGHYREKVFIENWWIPIDNPHVAEAWNAVNKGNFSRFAFTFSENYTAQLYLERQGSWEEYADGKGNRCKTYNLYWQEQGYPELPEKNWEKLDIDGVGGTWYFNYGTAYDG